MNTDDADSMVLGQCFFECRALDTLMIGSGNRSADLRIEIDEIMIKAGYTLIDSHIIRYPGGDDESGYSYDAQIGESALDIHTWPERNLLQFLAHTCGEDAACRVKFKAAVELLAEFCASGNLYFAGEMRMPLSPPK